MSVLEFLLLLLVAGICGSIARSLVGYSHGGCLFSVLIGFIGAMLGSRLATWLNLPDLFVLQIGDRPMPILWTIIGGALFAGVLQLLTRRAPVIDA